MMQVFVVHEPQEMQELKRFLLSRGAHYQLTSEGRWDGTTWRFWLENTRLALMTRLAFPDLTYYEDNA